MGNGNSNEWKDGYHQAINDAIREASKPTGNAQHSFGERQQIIIGRLERLASRKIKEETDAD